MQCVPAHSVMCLSLAFAVAQAGAAAAAPPALSPLGAPSTVPVPVRTTGLELAAVWRERHVDFYYTGRTARYSCDGLRDKVRALLLDLGARRDLKVVAIGCMDDDRLRMNSMGPRLSMTFFAPALPEPSAKPLHDGDLTPAAARFMPFMITSDAFRNLGLGDCELVEEFTLQVMPKLTTRDLQHDITCVPYQLSGSRFIVTGEVLRAVPTPEQTAGRRR